MSSLFIFNPFNIPNILTPYRLYAETQYILFSIAFLSLFAYILYEFFDPRVSTEWIVIGTILVLI